MLFNLDDIKDNATYTKGFQKSSGMDYVIVNGKILIEHGELQDNLFPGKAIKSQLNL